MLMMSAVLFAAETPWSLAEFKVISGPASPSVSLAARLDGANLLLAVEAAALPGGEPMRPWTAAMADYAPILARTWRPARTADRATVR